MIGFYCFTQPTPVIPLTIKQRVALLSSAQKTGLLNAFVTGMPVIYASRELKINKYLVEYLFNKIDEIQQLAKLYMRGEVVITPEVSHIDPATGLKVIDTPAVYNTPPATQAALGTILQPLFDDFTGAQVTSIVSAMVKWSKFDGTGTFTFYKTEIVK